MARLAAFMRATRNPFRRAHFWSRASALAVIVGLLAFSAYGVGLATEQDAKSEQRVAPPTSADQIRALARVVSKFSENPTVGLGRQVQAALNPKLEVSKRAPRFIKPFVFHSIVDGESILALKTTRSIKRTALGGLESDIPISMVRRNPATGAETTLYNSNGSAAVPVSVVGDGAVAMTVWTQSEGEKKAELSSSLLYAPEGSDELKAIATSTFTVDGKAETICGSFDFATSVLDRTFPVVASISATCDGETTLTASLKKVNPDGSMNTLFSPLSIEALFGSSLVAGNSSVLTSSPFDRSTGLGDFATQDFKSLWNGTTMGTAAADDGTVAILGAPSEEALVLEEIFDMDPKAPDFPLMLFPQGNPESLNLLAESADGIREMLFCDSNLYVLKSQARAPFDLLDLLLEAEDPAFFVGLGKPARQKLKVIAYRSSGELIGTLGTTPNMGLSSAGCSGGTLILVAANGLKTTQLRYQP